jgi:hypothetical protein
MNCAVPPVAGIFPDEEVGVPADGAPVVAVPPTPPAAGVIVPLPVGVPVPAALAVLAGVPDDKGTAVPPVGV